MTAAVVQYPPGPNQHRELVWRGGVAQWQESKLLSCQCACYLLREVTSTAVAASSVS